MNQRHALAFAMVSVLLAAPAGLCKKSPEPSGEMVFKQSCESCHPAGGNVVKPHAPVAGSEKLSTLAVFKAYLKSPVGHMPYYKNIVTDPKALKNLYEYCKSLKPPKQA